MYLLAVITLISTCLLGHIFCDQNAACFQPFMVEGIDIAAGKMICPKAIPTWSYDPKTQACQYWIYGGCGGNLNRFDTKIECTAECTPHVLGDILVQS